MSGKSAGLKADPELDDSAPGERVAADTLRFVRHFRVPVARVWTALTTEAGLAAWLGTPVKLELVLGGVFEVAFGPEDRMDGHIVEIEPNRRLSITWHETSNGVSAPYATTSNDESLVSFDLTSDTSGGTTLVFTHRYIRGGDIMAGFGAGWHAHLDSLDAALNGAPEVDRAARYAALKRAYDDRIAGAG